MRLRFRYSLRTMLLVVTLCALPLCWFGLMLREAARQKAIIESLQNGPTVPCSPRYDFDSDDLWFVRNGNAHSDVPQWLLDRLGKDFFHKVTGIKLNILKITPETLLNLQKLSDLEFVGAENVGDDFLAAVAALPKVTGVYFAGCRFTRTSWEPFENKPLQSINLRNCRLDTDAFLSIGRMKSLQSLELFETDVGNADVGCLSAATQLRTLKLHSSGSLRIGPGLAQLKSLENLTTLELRRVSLKDGDCAAIWELESLEELIIHGNHGMTDQALVGISRLKHLRSLQCTSSHLTDRSMEHLLENENLEELDLSGNKITGAGIAQLSRLKKLKVLALRGTSIGPAEAEALLQLPALEQLRLFPANNPPEIAARAKLKANGKFKIYE